MKTVNIWSSIGEGWQQFKRRPWYLLGLTLATFVLFAFTASDSVMATALSYILYGGYVALLLRHFAGEHVRFDDLFDVVDKRWIYFAFLGVIKGLLILLGFICFIIPGIYLAVRWMFAEILVIEKGLRPLEALKASSELTAGVRWKLFFYTVIAIILVGVSLLALIIGAVVAGIVIQLATIAIYKHLSSVSQPTEVVPEAQGSEG